MVLKSFSSRFKISQNSLVTFLLCTHIHAVWPFPHAFPSVGCKPCWQDLIGLDQLRKKNLPPCLTDVNAFYVKLKAPSILTHFKCLMFILV